MSTTIKRAKSDDVSIYDVSTITCATSDDVSIYDVTLIPCVERPGLYIYRGHVDRLGLLLKISLS
jgi:hypothetical protein